MVQTPRRAGVAGVALVRLLARLPGPDIPEPTLPLADQLSQWLRWNDAIELSTALGGHAPTAGDAPLPRASAGGPAIPEDAECARIRAALARGITQLQTQAATDLADDFASHRHRYSTRQQAMEAAIGPLRARLRARLAARTPAQARLAAVDAVMEQVLGARERGLLAGLPALLESHFRALRDAAPAEPPPPPRAITPGRTPTPPRPAAWLLSFRQDMQDLLLAELDLRMQPVDGLLEALRPAA